MRGRGEGGPMSKRHHSAAAGSFVEGLAPIPGLIRMLSRPTFVLLAIATAALSAPAAAQDAADFVVRMNRLENQVRQMSGHIEQLQFENRQLKDQLRKFEEDIEFRFQESAGTGGGSGTASVTSARAPRPPPSESQAPAMQPP